MLESIRLTYRKFIKGDYHIYRLWYQDAEVMGYITGSALNDEECQERFELMIEDNNRHNAFGLFAIFHKSDNSFFGIGRLSQVDQNTLEIGYGLFPKYWNQRYGKEIMDSLFNFGFSFPSTHKIIGITDNNNIPSIKILKSKGLEFEKSWPNEYGGISAQYSIQVHQNAQEGYKRWSTIYDSHVNKTRDIEKQVAQEYLKNHSYRRILELGCGTGKNTVWLKDLTRQIISVDFSKEMLNIARKKISDVHVQFLDFNILNDWIFEGPFDLITCSLVLEHIQDISPIFNNVGRFLAKNGFLYVCELHPSKYLSGAKARYEHNSKIIQVESYLHHVSDYLHAADSFNLSLLKMDEWFDDQTRENPRLVSFLFEKK